MYTVDNIDYCRQDKNSTLSGSSFSFPGDFEAPTNKTWPKYTPWIASPKRGLSALHAFAFVGFRFKKGKDYESKKKSFWICMLTRSMISGPVGLMAMRPACLPAACRLSART
jgi:hypothetical protein